MSIQGFLSPDNIVSIHSVEGNPRPSPSNPMSTSTDDNPCYNMMPTSTDIEDHYDIDIMIDDNPLSTDSNPCYISKEIHDLH